MSRLSLLTRILVLGALALGGVGCHSMSPAATGTVTSSDDLWYVKRNKFLFFTTSEEVFYCAPAREVGPRTCVKAIVHE